MILFDPKFGWFQAGRRDLTAMADAELILNCPTPYHMAERGSWPSIARHGLLSTSALLDLFAVAGPDRAKSEAARRPLA